MRETKKIKGLRLALEEFKESENGVGVCMCGDDVENHPSPLLCGHVPVDAHDYTIGLMEDEIRKEVEAVKLKIQEQGRAYRARKKAEQQRWVNSLNIMRLADEKRRKKREASQRYRAKLKIKKQALAIRQEQESKYAENYDRVEITLNKIVHEKLLAEAISRGTSLSALIQYYIAHGAVTLTRNAIFVSNVSQQKVSS